MIVVVQARAKHRTVHRIFEDNDARILRLVNNKFIGIAQSYHVAVAREDSHEIFAAVNALRPTRCRIEKLEYRVVGDSIEKLLSINKTGKALLDHMKNGSNALKVLSGYSVDICAPSGNNVNPLTQLVGRISGSVIRQFVSRNAMAGYAFG
jgi:hypothetical protein